MAGEWIKIVPWFGGDTMEVQALDDTDKVAYSWGRPASAGDDHVETIDDLLIWHDCDHSVMLANGAARADGNFHPEAVRPFIGWSPSGVGAHTLINVEPLHIEPSVYWPSCCGIHGFIRDGKWVNA